MPTDAPTHTADVIYGYNNGSQISRETVQKLDGMINVASLAAGASVRSSSPSTTYSGICSPADKWEDAVGAQEGWHGDGYPGWCFKQWCDAYGCNLLNGIYNFDASNTWQPNFPHNHGNMEEVVLDVEFTGAHVPEYVSIHFMAAPEDGTYTVQFTYADGGTSEALHTQSSLDEDQTATAQFWFFQLVKVPAALKREATGAVLRYTGMNNRPWPASTNPLVTLSSFDVWANATVPAVHFWNPMVPMLDENGNTTSWHQFLCNHMQSTDFEDTHFSVAPDSKGSEVSSIPLDPQTCIGNVIGGWIGYKSVKHPLCAANYAGDSTVSGACTALDYNHRPLLPVADGGCVEEDRASDRGLCKQTDRGTYSTGHGDMYQQIKAHCKMVKKTACKSCSTTPKANDTALDKTVSCPQETDVQKCQVKKICRCEYEDPDDSNANKPCDEGPGGNWRLTGLVDLCKSRCGLF